MKKIYSVFLSLFAFAVFSAQMATTVSGNSVTFTYTVDPNIWVPNGNPIYLYAYVPAGQAANPTNASDTSITGNWPGLQMIDTSGTGVGPYTLTVNLAAYFAEGTTVNDLAYIFNNNLGNQNPGAFQPGFSATTNAGFKPVTITLLGVSDVTKSGKSVVAEGKLLTAKKGNLDIVVYDFNGRVVKTLKANANGNPIDLNVPQKGLYLLKVSDATSSEVVKFAK